MGFGGGWSMYAVRRCRGNKGPFVLFQGSFGKKILELSGHSRGVSNWSGEFQWAIQKCKGKAMVSIILRLAWQAVVYYWIERNNRIHKGREKTVMQVLEQIKEVIRIRTSSLTKVKLDSLNFTLYSSWNLSQSIFV